MIRAASRFLAVLLFLGSTLAAPALAVAHGHAHLGAREHADDHAGLAQTPTMRHAWVIAAGDHDDDHAHPRLDPTSLSRSATQLDALPVSPVDMELSVVTGGAGMEPPSPTESPPAAGERAPPRSRAPPSL